MFKKGEKYGLMVLAVVAVVATVGLVMNLTGLTGAWSWTPPTISVCSDKFGATYNSRDYITYLGKNTYDTCLDSNKLNEAICQFNNIGFTQYDCRIQGKVCQNGACVSPALPVQPVCGNSLVETGEKCDDGNANDNDACVKCQNAVCGDGYVWTGRETCDDKGFVSFDGCDPFCQSESCVDSDYGKNPVGGGVATTTSMDRNSRMIIQQSRTDSCKDPLILAEAYCAGGVDATGRFGTKIDTIEIDCAPIGSGSCWNGGCRS